MSIAAKMAMMAMTTNNSMSVNDLRMLYPLLLQQEILQEIVERVHVLQAIRFAEDELLLDGDTAGRRRIGVMDGTQLVERRLGLRKFGTQIFHEIDRVDAFRLTRHVKDFHGVQR